MSDFFYVLDLSEDESIIPKTVIIVTVEIVCWRILCILKFVGLLILVIQNYLLTEINVWSSLIYV